MRCTERGGVLVQALIVIALLLALLATLVANQRVALNQVQQTLRQRRADVAARSALAASLAALSAADTNHVTLQDDWATLGDEGREVITEGDGTYRVQIVDLNSRVNVNTATEAQLQTLPLTQNQLSALLDWRDSALQGRTDGAKDDYYNNLAQPYNTKLARLTTLSELLLVKDWTAKALLEPQTDVVSTALTLEDADGNDLPLIAVLAVENGMPNTRADGSPRVNLNQGTINAGAFTSFGVNPVIAAQLVQRAPYASFAQLLTQPGITPDVTQQLLEGATFSASPRLEGKLNINTASEAVLRTLPGMTPDIAAAIVQRQSTGFASLGELSSVPGLNGALLGQLADSVGIGSDTFLVRAFGESGGVGVALEVVVGIRNGTPRVLTYERLPNVSVPAWWNWEEGETVPVEVAR